MADGTGGTSSSVVRRDWWKSAVVHQVYPRNFADSVGDLGGILDQLDYLEPSVWASYAGSGKTWPAHWETGRPEPCNVSAIHPVVS